MIGIGVNSVVECSQFVLQNFPVLSSWFTQRMLTLSSQPELDRYQLLLAGHHFAISSYSVRRELHKIEHLIDPPEFQRAHIVGSCLRQVVLTLYDLAREERQRWFAYWLDQGNVSHESIATVAYIVNLAAENQDLLSDYSRKYVANWHIRHGDLSASKFRAWAPRALALCGHRELAQAAAQRILSVRERNGSWAGGYGTTAATTYALLRSGVVRADELDTTLGYLIRRLQRGPTGDVALETSTLKALKLAGVIPHELETALVRGIERDRSVFLSHSSKDHSFVCRLGQALKGRGVKVWIDEADVSGGDPFIDKIEEGLADMQHLVVVLSPNSIGSFWVKRELNYGIINKVEGQMGKVIPVLLQTCEIPALLCERCYVDFREDFDKGLQELLRAIEADED